MKKILKKLAAAALSVSILCSMAPVVSISAADTPAEPVYTTQGNPYLPLWEYTPDGEP